MTSLRPITTALVCIALTLAGTSPALAQGAYPSKNIEVVVPFAPGGGTDNLMRMITGIMDENKWSPVALNVNNRAGGSGTVGYAYLIGKKGDSHVVAGATPMIVSGKLQGRLSGNHRDAMTVLMIVAIDELMLSVRSESPFKTVEEFVAAARAKPRSGRRGPPIPATSGSCRGSRRSRSTAAGSSTSRRTRAPTRSCRVSGRGRRSGTR